MGHSHAGDCLKHRSSGTSLCGEAQVASAIGDNSQNKSCSPYKVSVNTWGKGHVSSIRGRVLAILSAGSKVMEVSRKALSRKGTRGSRPKEKGALLARMTSN